MPDAFAEADADADDAVDADEAAAVEDALDVPPTGVPGEPGEPGEPGGLVAELAHAAAPNTTKLASPHAPASRSRVSPMISPCPRGALRGRA